MPDRLTCIVPDCRRTRGQRKGEPPIRDGEEWICGNHWKAVPSFLRRRRSKLLRRYRCSFGDTPFWEYPVGSPNRIEAARLDRMLRQMWSILKRGAIERAMWLR